MQSVKYRKNKTTELFRKLDKIFFVCSSINYWVDGNGIPETVLKAYRNFSKVVNVAIVFCLVAEVGAFFTQNDLTEKQKADRTLLTITHCTLYSFTFFLSYHKKTVTEVLFALAVELKKDFNDEETERQMLKWTRFYASALVFVCINAELLYGIDGLIQVFFADGTFVTVITVWPEVHDRRAIAEAARFGFYMLSWLWVFRIITPYLLVLTITISLSHQYTNLQMYFKSIAGIFEERMSQSDKEEKYERAFKVGVRMHATTIWCTQQLQKIGGSVFSGQIIVNTVVLVQLMSQLQSSDRTLSNTLAIVAVGIGMLLITGVIMWNAGDITVEVGDITVEVGDITAEVGDIIGRETIALVHAANLPTAIYLSGWQNCTSYSSFRIRRLLLIAIAQSQKPVVIKCCGTIEISYQSYVSIVKTSYSIFSVFY